jgi:chromosome segregation ATPase
MGRPKGSKNKPKSEMKSDVHPELGDTLKAPVTDDSVDLSFNTREKLYDAYREQQDTTPDVVDQAISEMSGFDIPQIENSEETEVQTEETAPQQETEEPSEEVKSEETPKEEVKEEIKEQKDERTVPYGALKEEREKRKERDAEINTLQSQVQQLIDDNKILLEREKENSFGDEDLDESQKQIKKLEAQVAELTKANEEVKLHREQDTQEKAIQRIQKQVADLNVELSKEGHPQIDKHSQSFIMAELNDMYAEDPEYAMKDMA